MSLPDLKEVLDRTHVQPDVRIWVILFGSQHRGLLTHLAEALQHERYELPTFHREVAPWFATGDDPSHRMIRLYLGVAARMAEPAPVDEQLVAEFGASVVADVQAELEGAERSDGPYPELRLRERQKPEGDALWPWEGKHRRPAFSVEVPLAMVETGQGVGHTGSLRFDWVVPAAASEETHVYAAPAHMAVSRTRPANAPANHCEPPWWPVERAILDYLAKRLGIAPDAASNDGWPAPYRLRLPFVNRRAARGDIRWWLTLDGGREFRTLEGNSFGLAYVLGLVRVLAKAGVRLPPGWERLEKEDLLSGVLGMGKVTEDGCVERVGMTAEKMAALITSIFRRRGRKTHTVVAAGAQQPDFTGEFTFDPAGWLMPGKLIKVLFVPRDGTGIPSRMGDPNPVGTVDDVIAQVVEHLGRLNVVDRAIRGYGEEREAEWRRTFAEPEEAGDWNLPVYVESQTLRMLHLRRGQADARPALNPESFEMPREAGEDRLPGRGAFGEWRPISREHLLDGLGASGVPAPAGGFWPGAEEARLRLLCVTHDAGQGKSAFLQWLERNLRERLPADHWVVLTEVRKVCLRPEELLGELADLLAPAPNAEVIADLRTRLAEGRIVFLVDGLDQAPTDAQTERLANLVQTVGKHCRWVVAGRPHALNLHWTALFERRPWRFLMLDYFTEADQKAYLGETLFERVTETIEAPKELLAVPRALYYVRQLAGESSEALEKIRTPSDVYLHALKNMVTEGFKAVAAKGIGYEEAMRLLAAMAFEMMQDRNFLAVESKGAMDKYLRQVARRYMMAKGRSEAEAAGYDEDWLRGSEAVPGPLRQLAAMNEVLNCGLLERGCPERIQWRNRSLQEFFAGYWLARYCLKEDQVRLRGMLYLDEEKETHDYRWMWRFLAEMPRTESDPERWVRALEPVYLPDDDRWRQEVPGYKRSTEVIWRTWARMERHGEDVIARFRSEFHAMLEDAAHPNHGIAKRLVMNFVRCPENPKHDNQHFQMGSPPSESGREGDEDMHSVQVYPFMMGRYMVTEDEYGLFEPKKPRRRGSSFPVVDVSWCDSWVYAKWVYCQMSPVGSGVECRLPTEAEWEFACRAGTTTAYCFGDDPGLLGEFAWYDRNSGSEMRPGGEKLSNGWGLHDVHGLAWEWCGDWYDAYEPCIGASAVNPTGPESGRSRVIRGGSWWLDAPQCRSARRGRRWARQAV